MSAADCVHCRGEFILVTTDITGMSYEVCGCVPCPPMELIQRMKTVVLNAVRNRSVRSETPDEVHDQAAADRHDFDEVTEDRSGDTYYWAACMCGWESEPCRTDAAARQAHATHQDVQLGMAGTRSVWPSHTGSAS